MPDSPDPPTSADSSSESTADHLWFERLAGRPTRAPANAQEVLALREADAARLALAHERVAEIDAPAGDAAAALGLRNLLFRLRAEGLLDATARRSWSRRQGWGALALAASLGAGALMVPWSRLQAPAYDEPPVMRGQPQLLVLKQSQPEAWAETLKRQLAQVGVAVRIYKDKGLLVVDVDVPPEALASAASILAAAGLPAQPGLTRALVVSP